jgi:hypothetical protein
MRTVMVLLVLCASMLSLDVRADGAPEVAADVAAPAASPLDDAGVPAVTAPAESLEVVEAAPAAAPAGAPPAVSEPTPEPTSASDPVAESPSTWASLGWQLLSYVVPVLGALLVALVGFGIQWIRAKTADLKWQSVLDQLEDAVDTAVAAVQQTTVDALQKAASDGKLTAAEAQAAFGSALSQVKAILGTKGMAALQATLHAGQETIEAYLHAKIEASVASQKVAP